MKANNTIITAIGIILAVAALNPAAHTQPAPEVTIGEVTKVDAAAEKITIKHGPIKKYDMDEGMTMVFKAGDPIMLKNVKAGDKIKFETDRIRGQFTVTRIEKTK